MTAVLNEQPAAPIGYNLPSKEDCAQIDGEPIARYGKAPMVWLVGAHGGAGVTTLSLQLGMAGDSRRAWPGGFEDESPYAVVVASETLHGLIAAHHLLVQHRARGAGNSECLGLITRQAVPAWTDKRMPREVHEKLKLVSAAADAHWRIDWDDQYASTPTRHLRKATPDTFADFRYADDKTRRRWSTDITETVPKDVLSLGIDLIEAIGTREKEK